MTILSEEILLFLKENLKIPPNNFSLSRLKGDGSDRSFYRINTSLNSFILIHNPPCSVHKYRENLAYKNFSIHLTDKGLPVPRLIAHDIAKGLFLMQDLGDTHLQTLVNRKKDTKRWLKAAELLFAFHSKAREGFDSSSCLDGPIYDPPFVIEKELEYFRKSFLNDFLKLDVSWNRLHHDFFYLAEKAGTYDTCWVMHRDFQSRNIMVLKNRLYIIDYQGMRFGPVEYDVASFLIDPYVQIGSEWKTRFLKNYGQLNPRFNHNRLEPLILCRNLQILAAFAFLGYKKKKTFFLSYIPQATKSLCQNHLLKTDKKLKNLRKITDHLCNNQKIMDRFVLS